MITAVFLFVANRRDGGLKHVEKLTRVLRCLRASTQGYQVPRICFLQGLVAVELGLEFATSAFDVATVALGIIEAAWGVSELDRKRVWNAVASQEVVSQNRMLISGDMKVRLAY
jgi:hypothetical protein